MMERLNVNLRARVGETKSGLLPEDEVFPLSAYSTDVTTVILQYSVCVSTFSFISYVSYVRCVPDPTESVIIKRRSTSATRNSFKQTVTKIWVKCSVQMKQSSVKDDCM